MKLDKKAILLALVSIVIALLISEAGLRLFTPFGPRDAKDPAPVVSGAPVVTDKPLEVSEAARYIAAMPAVPGTDRKWFGDDPPPLATRTPVSPQRIERYRDFERRGLYGPQADYIWNRKYVESERCSPNSMFRNYPETVLAFDPPGGDLRPHYRFAPSTTTFGGLVTNQFGLRGPPLTLIKPAKTIRIAFLGASTTVNNHNYPFSFPERVVYWLNRFAEANRYDVRFEVLNAGREGLNSQDFVSIVRDELRPLDPDWAVYYEGANQFDPGRMLVPPIASRQQIDARDPMAAHIVPAAIRSHLALGNLLDRVLNGFSSLDEPRKPLHVLIWPVGVSEQNPNVDGPKLPLHLTTIVKDLDAIRRSLKPNGAQLALCSFEWLARDGLPLSATRHAFIYKQLNTVLWPLRYSEIRRLADFQNRVFRRYAESRQIPYLDVAGMLPQDPNLFVDAIHMTDTGERVKAWIVFQQLVPLLQKQIETGQLPRPASARLPALPSLAADPMSVRCDAGSRR
ncbi:MAG TPA: hypothetical protein VEV17_25730 [Bryobacteraceae bacterium]|nr:hypothetical protein [Bryobacteraceae bacterium]